MTDACPPAGCRSAPASAVGTWPFAGRTAPRRPNRRWSSPEPAHLCPMSATMRPVCSSPNTCNCRPLHSCRHHRVVTDGDGNQDHRDPTYHDRIHVSERSRTTTDAFVGRYSVGGTRDAQDRWTVFDPAVSSLNALAMLPIPADSFCESTLTVTSPASMNGTPASTLTAKVPSASMNTTTAAAI